MPDQPKNKLLSLMLVCMPFASIQAMSLEEAELIDEGFRVFTEETFDGNGRTCATCHIPEKNYTISPKDIADLDDDERALVFASNVPGLENETLVEELALFNIGPGDAMEEFPEGPFRGSMTVAALEITSANNFTAAPPAPPVFPARVELGWSGDGSPSGGFHHGNIDPDADGSIRAFANGAIAQHNTRSLDRILGADFRFATAEELDAMDAFQRWLGRREFEGGSFPQQTEFDLALLTFSDSRVEAGKALFTSDEAACDTCHRDGGAHFDLLRIIPAFPDGTTGSNILQDTRVDEERIALGLQTGVNIPSDEGFFDLFNVQSIIEAPRKEAFFHNSAFVSNVEEAATFYFRPPFGRTNGEPGTGAPQREALELVAPGVKIDTLEDFLTFGGPDAIEKLGAFNRALSAFYSLRDCERLAQETIDRINVGASTDITFQHCGFNLDDVGLVLQTAQIRPRPYPNVTRQLGTLRSRFRLAARNRNTEALADLRDDIAVLRASIATTPEE